MVSKWGYNLNMSHLEVGSNPFTNFLGHPKLFPWKIMENQLKPRTIQLLILSNCANICWIFWMTNYHDAFFNKTTVFFFVCWPIQVVFAWPKDAFPSVVFKTLVPSHRIGWLISNISNVQTLNKWHHINPLLISILSIARGQWNPLWKNKIMLWVTTGFVILSPGCSFELSNKVGKEAVIA